MKDWNKNRTNQLPTTTTTTTTTKTKLQRQQSKPILHGKVVHLLARGLEGLADELGLAVPRGGARGGQPGDDEAIPHEAEPGLGHVLPVHQRQRNRPPVAQAPSSSIEAVVGTAGVQGIIRGEIWQKVDWLRHEEDEAVVLEDVPHGVHKLPLVGLLLIPDLALHAINPVEGRDRVHHHHLHLRDGIEEKREGVDRRQKPQAGIAVEEVEAGQALRHQGLDLLVLGPLGRGGRVGHVGRDPLPDPRLEDHHESEEAEAVIQVEEHHGDLPALDLHGIPRLLREDAAGGYLVEELGFPAAGMARELHDIAEEESAWDLLVK